MDFENELKKLYVEMEEKCYTIIDLREFLNKFMHLRELCLGEDDFNLFNKIQSEIDFLKMKIEDGTVKGKLISYVDDTYYPNYEDFSNETKEYLKERYHATKNPALKARYSIILWNIYRDHNYAISTIDSYFNLIDICTEKIDEDFYSYVLTNSIINAYRLSSSIKYKKKEAIDLLINEILNEENRTFRHKLDLIHLFIDEKKKLKVHLPKIEEYWWDFYQNSDERQKEDILKIGMKINNPQESKYDWTTELAKYYEDLANNHSEPTVKSSFFKDSMKYYKQVNNKKKVEELLKLSENNKKDMHFGEFKLPIDILPITTELMKYLTMGHIELLNCLSKSGDFIPKLKKDDKTYKIALNKTPILTMSTKEYFDNNYNNIDKFRNKNNKVEEHNLSLYSFGISILNFYLSELIILAIENKLLDFKKVMSYLKNTWLNKNMINGHSILYYVEPSIKSYFKEIENYLSDYEKDYSNFILAIDSLTLKIELIIKALCKKNHIGLTVFTDKYGKSKTEVKNLDKIFDDDEFKNLILEQDLEFLEYVLLNKGLNLRNKVAHGLDMSIYNNGYMNILFLCLLRLSKYN